MLAWPWLSIAIWLPLLGGLGVWGFGRFCTRSSMWVKAAALAVSVLTFIVTGIIAWQFDPQIGGMQLQEAVLWIPALGAHYALGVDGLALPLLLLSAFCKDHRVH